MFSIVLDFWSNWLYEVAFSSLVSTTIFEWDKIGFTFTNIDFVNALSVGTAIFTILFGFWLVKWCINFIIGVCSRYE